MKLLTKLSCLLFFSLLNACSIMHHTQVGEVDSEIVLNGRKFEILVSETGFNLKETAEIGTALVKDKNIIKNVQVVLSLFQMGPTTGNHVLSTTYADKIFDLLKKRMSQRKSEWFNFYSRNS